jgi:hypothetical protein
MSRPREQAPLHLWTLVEAVEEFVSKRRASLSGERQCVLEDVRGSALHAQILAVSARTSNRAKRESGGDAGVPPKMRRGRLPPRLGRYGGTTSRCKL